MEEVVCLLVHLLVGHLLHPGCTHVSLALRIFVAQLVVLSLLNQKCVPQVGEILCVLVVLAVARVVCLIVQLINKRVVVPVGLAGLFKPHFVDDFLVLLRAVVGLLVHLSFLFITVAFLAVPLTLLVNESLVHFEVRFILVMGLFCLCSSQFQVSVESVFFAFSLLLELHQVFFVALEGSKSSLVCYGHLLIVSGVAVTK